MKTESGEGAVPPGDGNIALRARCDDGVCHLNIWHVLGLALFLRALLPGVGYLYTRDVTIFDSHPSYVVPALELITYHRFFSHGAPEIVRTPGYPLLLMPGLLLHRFELVTIMLQ